MDLFADQTSPKAFDLDEFNKTNRKVTVGFKCNPMLKLQLANDAKERGLTLSEYVENLLLTLEENSELDHKQIDDLSDRLLFYENDKLLKLFRKYNGQEIEFKNADGDSMHVTIREPKDIYTILINSFRLTND